MSIDDRTSNYDWPLPHPDNFLSVDVARIRELANDIDAKFALLDALLQSDDTTLDVLQELVNQIKANRTDITAILTSKANQSDLTALQGTVTTLSGTVSTLSATVSGKASQASVDALKVEYEETQTLAAAQTVVNLTSLTSTAGCTVFIEGIRLKASEWTPHGSILTRLTLSTSYPAGHEITVVRRQGGA